MCMILWFLFNRCGNWFSQSNAIIINNQLALKQRFEDWKTFELSSVLLLPPFSIKYAIPVSFIVEN